MKRLIAGVLALLACLPALSQEFRLKPVAEKKLKALPPGSVEAHGQIWLFTLGPKGASTPGGSKVTEVGPVPALSAPARLP